MNAVDRLINNTRWMVFIVSLSTFQVFFSTGAQATVAGVTNGNFKVDLSGTATYQIPISVPPGTNGMQPALSLVYSSQGGDGHVGIGWSLSGLSAISRCPTTIAQEGFIDGVDYDNNDKYCLDGGKLVAINGGVYGAPATEYRTEIESFSKVVSMGLKGSGPSYFLVKTKSGQTLEYGNTADSKIEPRVNSNEIRTWTLNRVSDTSGNYFTITYNENTPDGEFYPDRIDYSANSSQGLAPYNSVRFSYAPRSNHSPVFLAGSVHKYTKKLINVRTFAGDSLVKDYRLAYDVFGSAGSPHISSIQECDASASCLQPTQFNWQESGMQGFDTKVVASDLTGSGWSQASYPRYFSDVNGDGKTDLVLIPDSEATAHVFLATSNGNFATVPLSTDVSGSGWNSTDYPRHIADVNADGVTDLVLMYSSEAVIYSFLGDGNGYFDPNPVATDVDGDGWNSIDYPRRLVDVNGDKAVDLVMINKSEAIVCVFISQINGQFDKEARCTDVNGDGWNGIDYPRYLEDVNSDGIVDFVVLYSSDANAYTFLGDGTGYYSQNPIATDVTGDGWNGIDYPRYLKDVNGDGNVDLVLVYGSETILYTFLGLGDGRFSQDFAITDVGGSGWNDYWYANRWADVNGDGLVDFIQSHRFEALLYVFLSKGDGTFLTAPEGTDVEGTGWNGPQFPRTFADVNGNGKADLIMVYDVEGIAYVARSLHKAKYVSEIVDSVGAVTSIIQNPLTDSAIYNKGTIATFPDLDLQNARYVVAEVSVEDGLGGNLVTRYHYDGLRVNLHGRGSLGFRSITIKGESTNLTSKTIYSRDFPTLGMALESSQFYDAGTVSTSDDIILHETSIAAGCSPAPGCYLTDPLNHPGVYFPFAGQSVSHDYEINSGTPTSTTVSEVLTFDAFGNAKESVTSVTGENLDNNSETYTTFTKNTYSEVSGLLWPTTRLTRVEVSKFSARYSGSTEQLCVNPNADCITRTSSFDYDADSGLLIQEVIEPDIASLHLQTDYSHDNFGNRISSTVKGGSGFSAIVERTASTQYDQRGQFPVSTLNALGHQEIREWDGRFGTPRSIQGPNQIGTSLKTEWQYDSFGRRILETRADGSTVSTNRQWCNGFNGEVSTIDCPAGGVLAETIQRSGAPATTVYLDKLGRTIRSETRGFDNTPVFIDTIYNSRGQVSQKSRPYYAGDSRYLHTFVYDAIGRVQSETKPDGSVISTTYNGLSTSVTNEKFQVTTQTKNVLGKLSQVTDAVGNKVEYRYDANSNLVEVEDNAQNKILTIYDVRGRKLSMNDPDMGLWIYQYNVLGELKTQTDANGNTISNLYDKLGRITQRTDPIEGISTWTYDIANKGVGKPASSHGAEGVDKTFTYDAVYGRPQSVTASIDGTNYTISRTYDNFGRLDTLVYPASPHYPASPGSPGGLTVKHEYNAQGYLSEVKNATTEYTYWQADAYDAAGNLSLATYGSGTAVDRLFSTNTGFLQNITSTSTVATIQDLDYLYDAIGNLESRTDNLQGVAEGFVYDDLNRLLSSNVSGNALSSHVFEYDSIGNIKSKTNIGGYVYGEGNAGPHAVSSIINGGTTRSFTYDLNGNIKNSYNFTTNTTRSFEWSSYNKPKVITQGGVITSFKYGEDRKRFKQIKSTGQGTTTKIYVNALYEKESSSNITAHIHYIRAAGQTVGIYKSVSTLGNDAEVLQYLHRDHLGSISLITDDSGQVIEKLSYDAFGKRRNSDWSDATGQIYAEETKRSYTGHEYLDEVGVIHMNGRIYDPDLGRFMSADPFIKYAASTQGFNRYSYADNNPLSRVDPSGFGWFKKLRKSVSKTFRRIRKELKRIESKFRHEIRRPDSYFAAVVQAAATYLCGAQCGAALVTAAQGGDLGDVVKSAAKAYLEENALSKEYKYNGINFNVEYESGGFNIGISKSRSLLVLRNDGSHSFSRFLGPVDLHFSENANSVVIKGNAGVTLQVQEGSKLSISRRMDNRTLNIGAHDGNLVASLSYDRVNQRNFNSDFDQEYWGVGASGTINGIHSFKDLTVQFDSNKGFDLTSKYIVEGTYDINLYKDGESKDRIRDKFNETFSLF